MTARKKRVAVLISGRGSNMAALLDAAAERDFPAEIVAVLSDNGDAQGLQVAAARGVPTRVVARGDFVTRAQHDAAIEAALAESGADIVALAGYMRRVGGRLVQKWSGRMINIHPALLPSLPGLNTHRRALEAGLRIHGCSVHFVTTELDQGPIIAQAAVPVTSDDTEETLAARVLKAEHKLYPLALQLVAEGRVRLESGRAVFDRGSVSAGRTLFSPDIAGDAPNFEDLARLTP